MAHLLQRRSRRMLRAVLPQFQDATPFHLMARRDRHNTTPNYVRENSKKRQHVGEKLHGKVKQDEGNRATGTKIACTK